MADLDFAEFTPTEFEEFCFKLLHSLDNVHNVDWRKGTAKASSPADRGRDIAAEVDHIELGGTRHVETWFVDCKHYVKGVPPEALQGLLSWAQAERPHVALVITSGFMSNAAKDYLADYEQNNRPPFRIRYWERPRLTALASERPDVLSQFFTSSTPFEPSHAEHIAQCEQAGCKHTAVFSDGTLGWCDLCRAVATEQEDELIALGARKKRTREAAAPATDDAVADDA